MADSNGGRSAGTPAAFSRHKHGIARKPGRVGPAGSPSRNFKTHGFPRHMLCVGVPKRTTYCFVIQFRLNQKSRTHCNAPGSFAKPPAVGRWRFVITRSLWDGKAPKSTAAFVGYDERKLYHVNLSLFSRRCRPVAVAPYLRQQSHHCLFRRRLFQSGRRIARDPAGAVLGKVARPVRLSVKGGAAVVRPAHLRGPIHR